MKSNLPLKIIILILAFSLAAGAILFFVKTRVTPPNNVETKNLHVSSIESDINQITDSKSMVYNDSLYNLLTDKIELFSKEDFIGITAKDEQIKAFILKYVPVFSELCTERFRQRYWDDTDFPAWRNRIDELRAVKLSDGTSVVQGVNENDLENILSVMHDYKMAKGIAAINSFTSVAQAKNDIEAAKDYAGKTYIEHSKIAADLENVNVRIGEAHYRKLVRMVQDLSNYQVIVQDEFNSRVSEVNRAFTEYENIRSIYGSAASDLESLKNDAGRYVREANKYYDSPQSSISVDLNSSWQMTASPNSAYTAYRSYSNWNVGNASASMSFEIKGYSSFTFYIDSYAEGSCDYVMVGDLNQMPAESSNYANTAGRQKPSTSFSNYKAVTYNNLDKSTAYRIYVVYRKDGSDNNNDDRGYILLPKIEQ